jgi:HSP20 family molecular chaperone IbpA
MAQKDTFVTRQETVPTSREAVRAQQNYVRPAVDIFETEQNLILVADMPGVDKERLDINLERGVLTLKGEINATAHGEPLFREFSLGGSYYRQFELSDDFDTEKNSAEFKNGVLTLTLAKSEAAKPKRIEIRH